MTDTPPLAGQVVVFAGTLSRMSRREAAALVERQLGRVATAVTRETTMLVVDAAPPEQGSPDERRVAEAMKLNARYPGRVRLLTEDEFYDLVMAGSGDPGAALYTTRAIRGLYPALRDDHLRYLERWGLIRPVSQGKTRQDTSYGFADLAVIRQASAELARGLTFRAVLRTLVAERTGQLAFDFQPARTDAQPAKVVTLRPRPRMSGGVSDQAGMGGSGGGAGGGTAAGFAAVTSGGAPVSEDAFAAASRHFAEASAIDAGDEDQQQTAILAYRRALALDPRMVAALVNLANLHYAHDAGPEAEALYEKALTIEPTCFEARFNLGNVYHDTGRFEEAVKCYVQALAVDQGYADAHFYLAVTLEKLGRSGEARPHWIAYQRLAPNGEWVELAREFSD
jgi:TPR repeat/BRCA1 C Terminus (BRCT) domain/Tetratricopeptide repeat